jgi:hypothetical protein
MLDQRIRIVTIKPRATWQSALPTFTRHRDGTGVAARSAADTESEYTEGYNDWHAEYPPVRSKDDVSTYFVVDTWGARPVVRLVRRNSEQAEELATIELPDHLANRWLHEHGDLKGICEPTEEIKAWLKKELGHE